MFVRILVRGGLLGKSDSEGTGYLEHAMERMNFPARAQGRILKSTRTAELGGSDKILPDDILALFGKAKDIRRMTHT